MIGKAIYARLAADTNITGICGTRIRPGVLGEEEPLPAITYNVISGERLHHTAGESGYVRPRVQIDCWATNYNTARSLADKVRLRIDGLSWTAGGIAVKGCMADFATDDYIPPMDDSQIGTYRVVQDFAMTYTETTP